MLWFFLQNKSTTSGRNFRGVALFYSINYSTGVFLSDSSEILSNLPPSLQGKKLTKFEAKFNALDDVAGGCRFDMQFKEGPDYFYIETKNYAKPTAFSSAFYNQFKAYISDVGVKNINQLKYFFKANSGVTKAERVQKFKNMLLNGNKYEEIYNAMSPQLKASLNIVGLNGKQQLYNLIESESNLFFNFIETF